MSDDLTDHLLDVISHSSIPRPVWHLAARERWNLLRDTLLGHVTMRGGVRPRDMPLDPDCRLVIDTAAACSRREYWAGGSWNGERMPSRFGDWLYVFAVLVEPLLVDDSPEATATAHAVVMTCVQELLYALDIPGRDDPNDCKFLHRLLGVLGLSRQEWQRLTGRKQTHAEVSELRLVARVAARVCSHRSMPEWQVRDRTGTALIDFIAESDNCDAADRSRLERLQREVRCLVSLKPLDVQDYIHRAKSHWMMRGASTWCAQALAYARDAVLEENAALLLSDSDAFVSFVFPKSVSADLVIDRIRHAWDNPDRFGRSFPRLAPFYQLIKAKELSPLIAMPDVSLRCSTLLSVMDLCLLRSGDAGFTESQIGWSDVIAHTSSNNDSLCEFVENEPAIVMQPPTWLEHRSKSLHGWTSLAWSLCGTTLRTHWHHGICATLGEKAARYGMMHVHHGGWLRQLDMLDNQLTFVKLDGDDVGAAFDETPIPGRPLRSLTLGQTVLERVIQATHRVVKAHDEKGRPPFLPVDLVYFGGDDVVFCLPGSYLPLFLAGFGTPLEKTGLDSWAAKRFSFIAVALPPGSEFDSEDRIEKSYEFGRANLSAVRTLSPGLRLLGKPTVRNPTALAELNSKIAAQGYHCDWAESPPDTGIAHGICLNLVRTAEKVHVLP